MRTNTIASREQFNPIRQHSTFTDFIHRQDTALIDLEFGMYEDVCLNVYSCTTILLDDAAQLFKLFDYWEVFSIHLDRLRARGVTIW